MKSDERMKTRKKLTYLEEEELKTSKKNKSKHNSNKRNWDEDNG